MKILFVGESWNGSSARSLREALAKKPDLIVDEIGEDLYRPKATSLVLRIANRVLRSSYMRELESEVLRRLRHSPPSVLIVYKGNLVRPTVVEAAKQAGIFTVNVFPDYSPHAYGEELRRTLGLYDLVVSTKPFHPQLWKGLYEYENACCFVPHGYDSQLHLWDNVSEQCDFDVVLAASWRPQYEVLLEQLAALLPSPNLQVAIAGNGWGRRRARLPKHWTFPGGLYGRSYSEFVRRGKIVIAPVHSEVFVRGKKQPGDQDTTRTYELAAAGCFFMHRRTEYARSIYDEKTEVPMWSNAEELAALITQYLPLSERRREIALAARARAVPDYSIDARADAVVAAIRNSLGRRLSA